MLTRGLLLLFATCFLACVTPATEVIVTLDTDAPASRVLVIQTTVSGGADGGDAGGSAHIWRRGGGPDGGISLPASFAITRAPEDSPGNIVTLVVDATLQSEAPGGVPITFRRTARFTFTPHVTTVIQIFLTTTCGRITTGCTRTSAGACTQSVFCEQQGQTCGNVGECTAVMVTPVPYDAGMDARAVDAREGGDLGVRDATDITDVTDAGDACTGVMCGPTCANTATDSHHCGGCATDCTTLPGVNPSTVQCIAGVCVPASACLPGRVHCTAMPGDGCETDINSPSHCGNCTTMCSGATPLCTVMASRYVCASSCGAATPTLCSGSCVDVMTDTANCGSCGHGCPAPTNGLATCTAGTCGFTCNGGYALCGSVCVASPGPACTPTAPCRTGTIACTAGAPACVATGNAAAGSACGSGMVCSAVGTCGACLAGAACMPSNPCDTGMVVCTSGTASCQDTGPRPVGTSCGSGMVCATGGMCVACAAGTSCPPGNPCHNGQIACGTGAPVCTDLGSALPTGSICGSGMVCNAGGTCVACASGGSCTPANPCHVGTISCSSGSAQCIDTGMNQTSGTACGSGLVCSPSGMCVSCSGGSVCTPANACHNGSLSCSAGVPTCNDLGTLLAAGTSCGFNFVCSAGGTCVACTPAGACSTGNPCTTGTIACGSGSPVCNATSNVGAGVACPGGVCNGAGTCNACSVGSACSTGNPCTSGTTSCGSGSPVCGFAGNTPAGSTCPGGVCNGGGTCNACSPGSACSTGNQCSYGTFVCSSGSPVCTLAGYQPAGTACGAGGVCDGSGSCNVCTGGAACSLGNPCLSDAIVCVVGVPMCQHVSSAAAGASCPGGVCNGSGTCVPCSAGAGCSTDPCYVGQTISCAKGGPVCQGGSSVQPGVTQYGDTINHVCVREYYSCNASAHGPFGSGCTYDVCITPSPGSANCQQNSCSPCAMSDCSDCYNCSASPPGGSCP